MEIRAQYRSLIYMYNSSNLTMLNTHFDKVQAKPSVEWGVVTIATDDDFECPGAVCEPILFDN